MDLNVCLCSDSTQKYQFFLKRAKKESPMFWVSICFAMDVCAVRQHSVHISSSTAPDPPVGLFDEDSAQLPPLKENREG